MTNVVIAGLVIGLLFAGRSISLMSENISLLHKRVTALEKRLP
jgi:hypothetical protein